MGRGPGECDAACEDRSERELYDDIETVLGVAAGVGEGLQGTGFFTPEGLVISKSVGLMLGLKAFNKTRKVASEATTISRSLAGSPQLPGQVRASQL